MSASGQQPWTADRRYGEGIGIRTGDVELHPGVSGEFGYDSNYFQRSPDEGPVSALRLRVTPSFSLSTIGAQRREAAGLGEPPKVNFRTGLYVSYNELFGSSEVSAQRHFAAGADLKLDVMPERPWGFDAYGNLVRTVEPNNQGQADYFFDRDALSVGAGINWRPGGGLFEWRLGYELRYNFFERPNFNNLTNAQHVINTRGRWRFLPRTALIYDAEYAFIRYLVGPTPHNSGDRLQARLGLNGLVSNHFALLAMGGWAQSYYIPTGVDQARNYDGFVAHAELKWFLIPQLTLEPTAAPVGLSSIAVGYIRQYDNSYLGDFQRSDKGYVNFEYFIGGTVLLSMQGDYTHISYPTSFDTNGQLAPSFGENRAHIQLYGEYRVSDTIGINSTLGYDANLTKNRVPTNSLDRVCSRRFSTCDQTWFSRFRAWIGARWFM
jgi:hypothetical protein